MSTTPPGSTVAGDWPGVALDFTAEQWAPAGESREVELRILVGAGKAAGLQAEVTEAAAEVLARAGQALGVPAPPVRLEESEVLEEQEFAILLGGRARLLGEFDLSFEKWWASHPAAGMLGRTGLGRPKDGRLEPAAMVVRAVEEVVWDDPGLLWSRVAALRFLRRDWAARRHPFSVSGVLRALLSWRIPLTDVDRVADLVERLSSSEDPYALEKEASRLMPGDIAVRTGAALTDEVAHPRFEEIVSLVLEGLAWELGITFPRLRREAADDLGPNEYQVVINGTPRATSVIPPNRRFLRGSQPVPDALQPLSWISPLGGWRGAWALDPGGVPPGTESSWDAAEFLGLHLAACLREAAPEFCNLAFVRQIFDRLDQRHPNLMGLVRTRFREEVVAPVLRGLLAEGASITTLPQILESLVEYDLLPPTALVLDEQEMRGGLRWGTDETAPLIEYVRASLKQVLSHQQSRGTGTVTVFLVGPELTATLRRLLRAGEAGRGLFDPGVVIPLLREIRRHLDGISGGDLPAVLSTIDLRAPLRRLFAAQQPLLRVLSYNDLTASSAITPLARLGG